MTDKKPLINYSGQQDEIHAADALIVPNLVDTGVTASRAIVSGSDQKLEASATTSTELGYVSGVTSAIQPQLNAITNTFTITKESTGFTEPENVIVTYDATSQKITLTGTVVAYWRGTLISALTTGWISSAHTDSVGAYYLYYDGSNFIWGSTFPSFSVLQIAIISYRAVAPFGNRECHGLQQWQSHQIDHFNIGTYRTNGGDISNLILASTTADNRRPIISTCTIHDEDCPTVNAGLTSKKYSQRYLANASDITYVLQADDIVPLSTARPYYNSFTTPNFGQTLMPANSVMTVWLYEVPVTADAASQEIRHVFVQGQSITQATSSSAAALITARNAEKLKAPSELNLGIPAAIVAAAEYVCIHKLIIQYTNSNWTITDSIAITGSRSSQNQSLAGNFLTEVTTDTTMTGVGTVASPLSIGQSVAPAASPTFAGLTNESAFISKQIATPSNPAAGYDALYFKSDDKLYKKDSAGNEVEVGSGAGGGAGVEQILMLMGG